MSSTTVTNLEFVVAGREFDLTDAETGRVLDFIAGIVAARDLGQ